MAVGSSLSQPPVTLLNTGNAITKKYFSRYLVDAIFNPSPTYWRLTRRGRKLDGGGALVWGVVSLEETSGGAYYGAQLLDTSVTDSLTPAELQWRHYFQSISIPVTDLLYNEGEGKAVDLITTKQEIAMGSLLQKLSRAIWGTSPQNTTIDIDPIPTALGAAGGTYAGITIGGANAWWLSNNGSGPRTTAGAATLANLQSLYGQGTLGNEEPDSMLARQAGWDAYWGLLIGNQRYLEDKETQRAGFRHLMLNNAVVMHDSFVPANSAVLLNTKYVAPVFHRSDYFRVDPFVRPTNQRVIVSQIWVSLNLQFLSLRPHARETNFTNF